MTEGKGNKEEGGKKQIVMRAIKKRVDREYKM